MYVGFNWVSHADLSVQLIMYFVLYVTGVSPRPALNGTTAAIVIRVTSNPFGMLSVSLLPPSSDGQVAEGGQINILVSRTGEL